MLRLRLLCRLVILAALAGSAAPLFAQGYGGTIVDFLVRGDILLAQGRHNEAIIQFQEVRTLCPTAAQTVHSLQGEAQAQLGLGDPLRAAGLYEEAVTRFPEDPRAADLLYSAGVARARSGDRDGARETLRRAIDSRPTPDLLPRIIFQLASVNRYGRPGEVIEGLQNFEERFPDHPLLPNAIYLRAFAFHDLARSGDAARNLRASEEAYRTLIERYPKTQAAAEALFELAWVLQDQGGRGREAADLYKTYAALLPSSPTTAKALERAGDLLLFRSPRESAQLYGLAQVKGAANPRPPVESLQVSGSMPAKRALANGLSRIWVVVLAILAMLVGIVVLGRFVVGRRRRRMAGA